MFLNYKYFEDYKSTIITRFYKINTLRRFLQRILRVPIFINLCVKVEKGLSRGCWALGGGGSDWQCPWAIAALSRPMAMTAYCKFAKRSCVGRGNKQESR